MSNYQTFFEGDSYILIGNSQKRIFPKLTFQGLINSGKKVYPVDPGLTELDGHKVYQDLIDAPQEIDGLIMEVPVGESEFWVEKAIELGVKNVWIHQRCESPEAIKKAEDAGINLLTGTCAVMYLTHGFNIHGIHRGINKIFNKY